MNNYDENANDAADRHARLMHDSLQESVPYRSDRLKALFGDDEVNDRPLETKAIEEQKSYDNIRRILTVMALFIIAFIFIGFWS